MLYLCIWAEPSEKVSSNVCKMRRFRSPCACAKSHPCICSLLKHCIVSNISVSGQRRPWSDCADAQADLGFRCPHMLKTRFYMARSTWPSRKSIKRNKFGRSSLISGCHPSRGRTTFSNDLYWGRKRKYFSIFLNLISLSVTSLCLSLSLSLSLSLCLCLCLRLSLILSLFLSLSLSLSLVSRPSDLPLKSRPKMYFHGIYENEGPIKHVQLLCMPRASLGRHPAVGLLHHTLPSATLKAPSLRA